ncbi:hypothetical protein LOZ56_006819, partial [Ophidiomyces ophidiicola]
MCQKKKRKKKKKREGMDGGRGAYPPAPLCVATGEPAAGSFGVVAEGGRAPWLGVQQTHALALLGHGVFLVQDGAADAAQGLEVAALGLQQVVDFGQGGQGVLGAVGLVDAGGVHAREVQGATGALDDLDGGAQSVDDALSGEEEGGHLVPGGLQIEQVEMALRGLDGQAGGTAGSGVGLRDG